MALLCAMLAVLGPASPAEWDASGWVARFEKPPAWPPDVWADAGAEAFRDILATMPVPPPADVPSLSWFLEYLAGRGVRTMADPATAARPLEPDATAGAANAAVLLERVIRESRCQALLIDGTICLRRAPRPTAWLRLANDPYAVRWATHLRGLLDGLPAASRAALAHRLPLHLGASGGPEFLARTDLLPEWTWAFANDAPGISQRAGKPTRRRRWAVVFEPTVWVWRADNDTFRYPVALLPGGAEAVRADLALSPSDLAARYAEALADPRAVPPPSPERASTPELGPDVELPECGQRTIGDLGRIVEDAGLPFACEGPGTTSRAVWVASGTYPAGPLARAAGWTAGLHADLGPRGVTFRPARAEVPGVFRGQWELFLGAEAVPFTLDDILACASMRWRDLTEPQERYLRGRLVARKGYTSGLENAAPEALRVAFVPAYQTLDWDVIAYHELDDPTAIGYHASWPDAARLVWPAE